MSSPPVASASRPPEGGGRIPGTVVALGMVSLFMDLSSEAIHALLPLFLASTLGLGGISIGLIEGSAEGATLIVKAWSGTLSDRLGRRKLLLVTGYALAAVSKPFFALATGWVEIFAARFTDRVGKGIRGAPRDALIADVTDPQVRGAAYGLRQSLDTIGAVVGPLLAAVSIFLTDGDFRAVFLVATIPAFLSVAILIVAVREPAAHEDASSHGQIHFSDLSRLGGTFWRVVAVGAFFMLARCSEAFLLLRARSIGLSTPYIPLVLVVMNLVYSASAFPAGRLSDRIDRRRLFAHSLLFLAAAHLLLAAASSMTAVMVGIVLWGGHMGLSQGALSAFVAEAAPADLRGTAFGLYGMIAGGATLLAGAITGILWQTLGPSAPFLAGALFAGASLLALLLLPPSGRLARS
ncbi:MAG: MFS transporter [Deltaproteobacteria bacterium]|nr:MAG: MFS transporter [Deltaproteobacteria bacterium]